MENEGLKHIHKIMHVFIEGLAAGVYESVNDIQADACEYLAMERMVEKLSNWKETDTVADLVKIFDGVANSQTQREFKQAEDKQWQDIQEMPLMELTGKDEAEIRAEMEETKKMFGDDWNK